MPLKNPHILKRLGISCALALLLAQAPAQTEPDKTAAAKSNQSAPAEAPPTPSKAAESKPAEQPAAVPQTEAPPDSSTPGAAETTPQPTPATDTPTATPQPIKDRLPALIAEIAEQIRLVEAEISPERLAQTGASPERVQAQLDRLRDVNSIYQRHMSALKRVEERRRALADLAAEETRFAAGGMAEEPPYKISQLDALRDQLASAIREDNTLALAVENASHSLQESNKKMADAETARREARDRLRDAGENAGNIKLLEFNFEMARIENRLARANQALAETQLEGAQAEMRLSEAQTALLRKKVDWLAQRASFSKTELDEKRAEIDKRRERLETRLQEANRNHATNERWRDNDRTKLEQARTDKEVALAASLLDRHETWVGTSARELEYLEESLADLRTEAEIWEMRFELAQGAGDPQLAAWEGELDSTLESFSRRREVLESRLVDTRAAILDVQKQLDNWVEGQGIRDDVESKLLALKKREENAAATISSWSEVERLARRTLEEVRAERSRQTWSDKFLHLGDFGSRVWGSEIFSKDDIAYRVGHFVNGGLILFGVIFLFRFAIRVARRITDSPKAPIIGARRPFYDQIPKLLVDTTSGLTILIVSVYLASFAFPFSAEVNHRLRSVTLVILLLQVVRWGSASLELWVEDARKRSRVTDPAASSAFGPVVFFGKVALWSVALLLALDNLGFNVTGILAGLGIGGVAVAFALQNVLGDVICSVAILLDKPFVVGDFITVEDQKGVVELIGVKTTRVRSISGEQIIFPNANLIGSRIRNFKRMWERRAQFTISVAHDTRIELIERIPGVLKEIIEAAGQTRFEGAHFARIAPTALDFETVYYVLSPEQMTFMDIQQRVNLEIMKRFREMGVELAVPKPAPAPAAVPAAGNGAGAERALAAAKQN